MPAGLRLGILAVLISLLLWGAGCASGGPGASLLSNPSAYSQELSGNLPPGTIVDELDLSNLKVEEAKVKLQKWGKDKLEQSIRIVYNDTEVSFKLKDLGIELDFPKTWANVLKNPGKAVPSVLKIDSTIAAKALQDKFAKFTRQPQDAGYKIENNAVVIKPGVNGQAISLETLTQKLEGESFSNIPPRFPLVLVDIPPNITTQAIQTLAFDGLIGEYTTKFNVKEKNRSDNLAAAAKKLDKTIIRPGEVFSFNEAIGPRTAETGYKDAYIIINNEYVQGIGGGICQVSSTLYSAALLANLTIVERSPHAVAVSYIPLGQDATVNYPDLDLKIRNDTQSLVYIRTEVKPGILTVKVFGKKTNNTVRLEQQVEKETDFQTIKRLDPELKPGEVVQEQAGSKGYVVKTWRLVRDETGKETKQLLSRDEYAPANRILKVGVD